MVDISGIRMMSSDVLAMLLDLRRRLDRVGGWLRLVGANSNLRDMLRTCRLESYLPVAADGGHFEVHGRRQSEPLARCRSAGRPTHSSNRSKQRRRMVRPDGRHRDDRRQFQHDPRLDQPGDTRSRITRIYVRTAERRDDHQQAHEPQQQPPIAADVLADYVVAPGRIAACIPSAPSIGGSTPARPDSTIPNGCNAPQTIPSGQSTISHRPSIHAICIVPRIFDPRISEPAIGVISSESHVCRSRSTAICPTTLLPVVIASSGPRKNVT